MDLVVVRGMTLVARKRVYFPFTTRSNIQSRLLNKKKLGIAKFGSSHWMRKEPDPFRMYSI